MTRTIDPQLAENINPAHLEAMITSDRWGMQQKLDGKRTMISYRTRGIGNQQGPFFLVPTIESWNRWGAVDVLPDWTDSQFKQRRELNGKFIFDGELITTIFWCFDLVIPGMPFRERSQILNDIPSVGAAYARVPTAWTTEEKRDMLTWCHTNHSEGVIFRHGGGLYKPGVRNNEMLKLKFTKTADCIIWEKGRDGKRAFALAVIKDGKPVDVGSVGSGVRDEDFARGKVGDVVEVKYLYLTGKGRLFQPAFLKFRPEKPIHDCEWDQLIPTSREIYYL